MIPYRIQQAGKHVRSEFKVLRGMLHLDTHDLAGTVLLAGSGRSGTTWMSQIINHGNPYRDIFEPFHPQHVSHAKGWPFMRYLPADQLDDAATMVVMDLLAGRIRSRWTDAYNRRSFAQQRLIKAIRTNLMLGWVRSHCPQVKLLFAMRHPCAVVHSRVKLQWNTHLDQLLAQQELMRDHLEPYRETIDRAERSDDLWVRHLAMWCIENVVPLRELGPADVHLLRYEDLCQRFDEQVVELFAFLGRPVPQGVHTIARQRSAHFRRDSAIMNGGDLIGDWQQHVEPKHIDAMLSLLHTFGLDHLYNEGPAPLCDRDTVFIDSRQAPSHRSVHKDAA
ncbi:MAG: sulfotransferase domain-containing protein [Planctomycetota bacterium]